jgi:hypothetical protein
MRKLIEPKELSEDTPEDNVTGPLTPPAPVLADKMLNLSLVDAFPKPDDMRMASPVVLLLSPAEAVKLPPT